MYACECACSCALVRVCEHDRVNVHVSTFVCVYAFVRLCVCAL